MNTTTQTSNIKKLVLEFSYPENSIHWPGAVVQVALRKRTRTGAPYKLCASWRSTGLTRGLKQLTFKIDKPATFISRYRVDVSITQLGKSQILPSIFHDFQIHSNQWRVADSIKQVISLNPLFHCRLPQPEIMPGVDIESLRHVEANYKIMKIREEDDGSPPQILAELTTPYYFAPEFIRFDSHRIDQNARYELILTMADRNDGAPSAVGKRPLWLLTSDYILKDEEYTYESFTQNEAEQV
ncbi:hypothetical protein [Pseudomonas orientalis]|uniref:hypothetical protein n=1 Tax=Pseudomonas orientalis TaxID=76758 RepID=UPI000F56E017|nr:hypothetical protein [Pseudomonas orientalis]